MPSKSVDELLRALYRGREDAGSEASARLLEQQLVAAHERRYGGQPRGGALMPFALLRRAAVALVVLVFLSVGACQMPVSMHVTMGQRVHFVLPATSESKARVDDIARQVEAISGATKVEVKLRYDGGETLHLTLGVWGESVDPDAVFEDVARAFPELEIIDREAAPLEGTVRTTLGDKLRHDLFQRALDEDRVEDARRVILEQLAAEGFDGDADVRVYGEGEGHRRVEIRLRGESTEDVAELRDSLDADVDAALELNLDLGDRPEGVDVDVRTHVRQVVKVTEVVEEREDDAARATESIQREVEIIRKRGSE